MNYFKRYNNLSASRKVFLVTCIGWGLGSAGISVFNFSRTLILRFMTDNLEITVTVAGLLFAFSKIFDAVIDPVMGMMSDRTVTRWGRRRPYLLVGALLCGIAYILLFNIPAIESKLVLIAYMAGVLMFYAVAYTIFTVPYLAMPVEFTSNYHERSFLVSFRAIGIAVGNMLGGVVGPLVIAAYGGGLVGHQAMSWVLGGITVVLMLFSFFATSQAAFTKPVAVKQPNLWQHLSLLMRNRPYIILLLSKALFIVGISVLMTSSVFFTTHVLQAPDTILAVFFACFFIGVTLSQPLWLKLSRRWDKPFTYTVACILLSVINLTWLLADIAEPRAIFIIRSIAIGISMGGAIVMGQSMLQDTLEDDTRRSGIQREGVLVGFYTTLEKSGSALGIAIVGLTLGLMGYVESSAENFVVQSEETILAIKLCFSVIPTITLFLSGVTILFYTLNQSSFKEV